MQLGNDLVLETWFWKHWLIFNALLTNKERALLSRDLRLSFGTLLSLLLGVRILSPATGGICTASDRARLAETPSLFLHLLIYATLYGELFFRTLSVCFLKIFWRIFY